MVSPEVVQGHTMSHEQFSKYVPSSCHAMTFLLQSASTGSYFATSPPSPPRRNRFTEVIEEVVTPLACVEAMDLAGIRLSMCPLPPLGRTRSDADGRCEASTYGMAVLASEVPA